MPPTGGSASVVVYYDENANGALDPGEDGRIPGVRVTVAGSSATTAVATGRATLAGVPDGTHDVAVDAATLPPFFVAPEVTPSVSAPGGEAAYPLTLPIGDNRPNTYMAFGDSISDGSGFGDGNGYRVNLQNSLQGYFGSAEVINQGVGSTSSAEGAARIAASLAAVRPAYTLIHYGTLDWHRAGCRGVASIPTCFTIPSLREIVREVRAAGSLPCLATIIPSNTNFNALAPPQRNEWIDIQDDNIRALAVEEGALLVDLEMRFYDAGPLNTLFVDHIHPNDRGFEVMAEGFFESITRGQLP
jgi:lysophospholipase L1-like esterase